MSRHESMDCYTLRTSLWTSLGVVIVPTTAMLQEAMNQMDLELYGYCVPLCNVDLRISWTKRNS